jgi:hypothetical protein
VTFDFFRQWAFEGVGDEGVEGAGGDGHFAHGGGDAEDDAGVFGLVSRPPAVHGLAVEHLEAISGDVLGEAEPGGVGGFAGHGQRLGQPASDVLGDLADTGLREGKIGGELAGRGAVEEEALVDLEVAGRRREGNGHGRSPGKDFGFQIANFKLRVDGRDLILVYT